VWDQDGFHAVAGRQLQVSRGAGALGRLPLHLSALAMARASRGDLTGAAHLLGEVDSVAATTGARINPYAWLRLRALQGREYEGSAEIANVSVGSHDHWAAATLHNGLARYHEAAMAAQQAIAGAADPWVSMWALPELVEAAGRGGETELARDALNRLTDTTRPIGNDLARGIEARCQALVSAGATAEDRYLEAVRRLTRTKLRPEFARAHLLYGEWLRREGRRIDAREQLRTAHDLFAAMGMEAFAERARRELNATGERVRKRRDQPRDRLTPQEEQIARLARDGLSNPEISAQLFISARTVEWHLRKVFMKLGITSRRQLRSSDEPTLTAMVDPASGGRFPDLG
jgi:DNA-binding CsgD family transcriptional regulator